MTTEQDILWMRRAIELSLLGEGRVEPNPMVGCVLVRDQIVIGEGWHEQFGAGHAEVNAISAATEHTRGATAHVTLEPCSHHGKTPPCCDALIQAQVARVVVAIEDPNPDVAGKGLAALRAAGIEVTTGVLADEARSVMAPYLKRAATGLPWVIAKWAMTIDGKIASPTGDSKWISNESSRAIVHQLRGRVDAILTGSGTATADDPLLNARPAGARVATRVVLDSDATLSLDSKLVQTAADIPVLIACGPNAAAENITRLQNAGCEVWQAEDADPATRLNRLLTALAERGFTNVMVEAGAGVLGALNDLQQIDEIHAFIGPKLLGGTAALTPVGGSGHALMKSATAMQLIETRSIENDVYCIWRKLTE